MCRFVLYLGPPMDLAQLTTLPRNSIIHQSYQAEYRLEPLNGDGFGIAWYAPDHSEEPAVFRSIQPAWNNLNLRNLARVTTSPAILAHVRAASPGLPVMQTNCHPFTSGPLAFCHNGFIPAFSTIKRRLRARLSDEAYIAIEGSTDSEHVFALVLDRLKAYESPTVEAMKGAMEAAIADVLQLCCDAGVDDACQLNLALTNGREAVVCRFTNGAEEDPNSLFVHAGRRYICDGDVCRMVDADVEEGTVIVASEPLSDDPGWDEVPAGHFVVVTADRQVSLHAIEVADGFSVQPVVRERLAESPDVAESASVEAAMQPGPIPEDDVAEDDVSADDVSADDVAADDVAADDAAARRAAILEGIDLATSRWLGAGTNGGATLQSARETIEEVIALLRPTDAADLRTRAVVALAGICHDIGDLSSLDRALEGLGDAVRGLTASQQPVAAARLLNDEAAVWLRIGDPVRAHGLLRRSRALFADKASNDSEAVRELAETDHQLARLPLHVAARPGREADAIDDAIEAAMRAERAYAGLQDDHHKARVMATRGRLMLAAGRLDDGASVLLDALQDQEALHDEVAMANTSAALGEALALADRVDDGLRWLARSAQLNARKGARQGLAANQAMLDRLAPLARSAQGRNAAMVTQVLIDDGIADDRRPRA